MVFNVRRDQVLDLTSPGSDLGFGGFRQRDGGEDCDGARGEADSGAAAADGDFTETGEGYRKDGDVGREVADDHYLVGVVGDEGGGHDCFGVLVLVEEEDEDESFQVAFADVSFDRPAIWRPVLTVRVVAVVVVVTAARLARALRLMSERLVLVGWSE